MIKKGDNPKHEVTLDSFHMANFQVTQELYESVTGENPSGCGGSNRPVENVCWYEAVKWTVECDFTADGYRVPTEAKWEYEARGGQKTEGYEYI